MDPNNNQNKECNEIWDFITETKGGKYTDEKPELTITSYERFDPQGSISENPESIVLYGISI